MGTWILFDYPHPSPPPSKEKGIEWKISNIVVLNLAGATLNIALFIPLHLPPPQVLNEWERGTGDF